MKNRTAKQVAQNIIIKDIALHLVSYIYYPELLSPSNPLLIIFEFVVKKKPEIDDKRVKKDWDCLACKVCPWDHAKFCKIVDSQICLDLFKGFQIFKIINILQWKLCNVHHTHLGQIFQLEKCEPRVLKTRTVKF